MNSIISDRGSLLLTCFIGHCLYYLTRKSTTYSIPILLNDSSISFTKDDFGVMASIQMATYTAGKFATGFLVDRISCKRIFCFGLLCCGVVNIGFGMIGNRESFFVLTFLNGLFQACGWNAIAVLIKKWYAKGEVGGIWSLLSSTINIGTSMTPFVIMFITKYHHWKFAFIIVGIATSLFALLAFFTMQEYKEVNQTGISETKPPTKSQSSSLGELVTSLVFWTLSTCYALWSLVKGGTEDWLQLYLISDRNLTEAEASFNVVIFQIGGFVASLFSGSLSDRAVVKYGNKMTGNPRLLLIICASSTSIIWFYCLQNITSSIVFLSSTCFMLGACCYVPHTLFGLIVVESAPMEMSGTAHALSTTISSVGSVLGGYPLVYISTNYGWNGAYSTLIVIALVTTALLFVLTRMETKITKKKVE